MISDWPDKVQQMALRSNRAVSARALPAVRTIVDGAVPIVKISRLADQVTELASLEATRRPVDLRDRAGPRLMGKDRREGFTKGPIEAGVVRNDQVSRFDEGFAVV